MSMIGLNSMYLRIAPFASMALLLTLSACSDGANAPLLDTAEQRLSPQRTVDRISRLRVGDQLRITVFGEQDLSGNFEVNTAGRIAIPLVGEVQAEGLAVEEFRKAVTAKLAQGYLKSPRVTIEAMNYRPIYIHGEVRKGGEFPFRSGLRLRDAIALAGGFTYRANQDYLLIVRSTNRDEYRVPLESNIEVLPGDNIRVPERFF